jgi:hypothetical protein
MRKWTITISSLPMCNLRLSALEQHDDSEYGEQRTSDGAHCGGPFWIKVSPKMRVEEVRHVVSVSRLDTIGCHELHCKAYAAMWCTVVHGNARKVAATHSKCCVN